MRVVREKVVLYCLVKKKREERLSCSQLLSGGAKTVGMSAEWHHITTSQARRHRSLGRAPVLLYRGILQ